MRGRNGAFHRYYYCRNHDPIRARCSDRRCTERSIRADVLDAFVITQVRDALLRPEVLLSGQQATTHKASSDELLAKELSGPTARSPRPKPNGAAWPISTRPV
ncbi:zinc ribbon domain-containing protein [Streptomyces sp. NPDC055085]